MSIRSTKEMLKTVVFGYDEILLESIGFLTAMQSEIAAVVFPSNRRGPRANKVRNIVQDNGFRTLEQPPRASIENFVKKLDSITPDLILVWSYPMILPVEVIQIPRLGCINVHLGLLPQYRGVNGVRWALLNGEDKTGVTLHFMDEGIDSGDMIANVTFPITDEDDILSLMQKSIFTGRLLLESCWPAIAAGNVERMPQDESNAAYFSAEMQPPELIDWSRTSVEIHNLIRASAAPYPGVYASLNGRRFRIVRSRMTDGVVTAKPGTIETIDQTGIHVATGSGLIALVDVQPENAFNAGSDRAKMDLRVGDKFEDCVD
jgi:methionyl-tRNA formyltransferase